MKTNYYIPVATLILFTCSASFSQVVIQHTGSTDPVNQGWSLTDPANAEVGPVFDDQGLDAWSIQESTGSQFGFYEYRLSDSERQSASSQGWGLFARVKILEMSETSSALLEPLTLSVDANGDPRIKSSLFGEHIIDGGAGEYHDYLIQYDPMIELLSFWINGTQKTSVSRSPEQAFPTRITFGSGQNIDLTHTHWNEVTFTIVPEPATVALLFGIGALFFTVAFRWRKWKGRSCQ